MDEIEQKDAPLEESEEAEGEEVPESSEEKPKKEYTTEQKLARVERIRAKYMKELGLADEPKVDAKPSPTPKSTELDENALDYLDLKGISEEEDIEVIKSVVKKTGMTVRQALKDEYVQSKLNTLKEARTVRDATPSSSKRSGNQTADISALVAKFEQTGELPSDFATRSAVVNAFSDKGGNKPGWQL